MPLLEKRKDLTTTPWALTLLDAYNFPPAPKEYT
jgi:hypothetical protein